MVAMLANPDRLRHEAVAAALMPPPPVDYLAWAVKNISFTKRESPEPGPYNPDRFAYFTEILKALSPEDPCRIVTLAKSAQLGGTVLANIFTCGSMEMDPGDLMYVHPTENNAERWSKMKLRPMLRNTSALKAIFPEKSRDGGDSTLYKERADGLGAILISGANSPASLSQVTMPRQVQDDLSKWENNSGGDPESQADSRSRAITFAKIFKISTPLVMPGCRITKSYDAGSQERLYVPCPHCDTMQSLEWENLLADFDEDRPEAAHFTCVACGCEIEEHHRSAMLPRGEWRADNPKMKRFHRSFYLWSAYSLLQSWRQIALEWLKARGDPAAEQTFLNDTVGKAFRAQSEAPPWEGLRDRAAESDYAIGTIPLGALLLTLGLDCQLDRVETQLVGFGRDGRRFVIDYRIIPGHISEPATQARLNDLMEQTWPNTLGRRIGIDLAAIDGNAWTEDVWSWAQQHPSSRVIMVRGVPSESAPLLARVAKERNAAGKLLAYSRRFHNFGTSVLKMALYRNLMKVDPQERGFIGFARGLEDEYFRQLTAERRQPVKRHGFTVYRWEKDPNQANEGLDTHLQAEAAAIKLGLRGMPDAVWDRLEADRERAPEPVEDVPVRQPEPKETASRPASQGWFGDRTKGWLDR
ncbi:Phage terminase, large subunit GpA [Faunimonas pinastri]|uniref:Phage terminase, large subunit GpA n=1 Tax=Faunimonas pinastri TaxID=1855383 RepID=A0A1H9GFN1_9HYPH|nr:terminase gpA endonuclease subunit [Faunimonas pinastri]SEQ48920.1 Phage terminase, large subunit GpA [Faunimonas pinastri]